MLIFLFTIYFFFIHSLPKSEVAQSCPTLCDPMDCNLPGFSVHGISQAWILEGVAISFSRGSSPPRDWTRISYIAGRCFTLWATREVHSLPKGPIKLCYTNTGGKYWHHCFSLSVRKLHIRAYSSGSSCIKNHTRICPYMSMKHICFPNCFGYIILKKPETKTKRNLTRSVHSMEIQNPWLN